MFKRNWVIILASVALLGSGCLFESDKETKRGTVVDNELRVGFVYLADGSPAKGARVRLFPVDHLPDSGAPAFSDFADEHGKYQVDSLVRGEYNVLSELKGQYSFADSVFISEKTGIISNDTLGTPGSIAGIVGLQPNHDPITTTVQVMGTNAFANVEGDGHFRLNNLARGTYTLRVLTTLPEYTPLYKTIRVEGGKIDSLKDTLWLPFTGIPVVREISASYDTLQGVVHLRWTAVAYRGFSDYLIYRDSATTGVLSYYPIGVTTDTTFSDTLFKKSPDPSPSAVDPFGVRYRYRIRIRNQSDQIGLSYRYAEVDAPSPSTITTTINASVTQVKWDAEKKVDSTQVEAQLSSTGRGLVEITWALGSPDSIVSRTNLGSQSLAYVRFKFAWPREGVYGIYIKVKDVAGTVWNKTVWVMSNRTPQLNLNMPDTLQANRPISIAPQVYDPELDRLHYSAVGLPKWLSLDTLTGTMSGTPENRDTGKVTGIILSVNDGRRSVQTGPIGFTVKRNPWSLKSKIPFPGEKSPLGTMDQNLVAVSLGDSILVLRYTRGHIRQAFFTPATDTWSAISDFDLPVERLFWGHAYNGEAVVFGLENGNFADGSQVRPYYFNLTSSRWRLGTGTGISVSALSGAYLGGKFMMAGNMKGAPYFAKGVLEYEPAADTWAIHWGTGSIPNPICFAYQGKLNTVFGIERGPISLEAYDPAANEWKTNLKWPEPIGRLLFSLAPLKGLIYIIGGYMEWSEGGHVIKSNTRVDAYDLAEGKSKRMSDRIHPNSMSSCIVNNNKIYCFGGAYSSRNGFDDSSALIKDDVEEYDPALEN